MQSIKEIEDSLGGRPRVKEKKVRVSVYLSKEEHKTLKKFCEEYSFSISQYVRLIILRNLGSLD
ncbi:MAG: ribbon-helix-helix domain-containing protein [Poseidonibacter sp.]